MFNYSLVNIGGIYCNKPIIREQAVDWYGEEWVKDTEEQAIKHALAFCGDVSIEYFED